MWLAHCEKVAHKAARFLQLHRAVQTEKLQITTCPVRSCAFHGSYGVLLVFEVC